MLDESYLCMIYASKTLYWLTLAKSVCYLSLGLIIGLIRRPLCTHYWAYPPWPETEILV